MSNAEINALVEYFGGFEILARILNVRVEDLKAWAEGRARPPTDISFRLLQLSGRA
jgi:hypothetical protein